MRATTRWALQRQSLVVNPTAVKCWSGISQNIWAFEIAREIAWDLRALGAYLGVGTYFYWGASGGSWFLSGSYIDGWGEWPQVRLPSAAVATPGVSADFLAPAAQPVQAV